MATLISWTNETWNPTTGCSRVSEGCRFCYAEALSLRFGWSKKPWTAGNAEENLVTHPERLRKPYSWKKPVRVFVNSMSDLFHEQIPDSFIREVFAVMNDTPHTYQILTKRPDRAAAWPGPWSDNIWMGTSVEDQRVAHRIDALRSCKAKVLFLSCEPLIGPIINPDLTGIDWVIAGGESGRHLSSPDWQHRFMDHAWARDLRDACLAQGAAYFFKQSSGVRTEMNTALDHGDGTFWKWEQYPGSLTPPVQANQAGVPLHQALTLLSV